MNIIVTDRLTLRTTLTSDVNILHEMIFSDPKVMSKTFTGKTFTKEESIEFFNSYFDNSGGGKKLAVLTLKDTNEIIGFSGLLETSVLGQTDYEIGFVLGKEHWGKGYASEIGHAQINYGLGLLKCNRLLALVAPSNQSSISVLLKIGMSFHSTVETKDRGTKHVYIIDQIT